MEAQRGPMWAEAAPQGTPSFQGTDHIFLMDTFRLPFCWMLVSAGDRACHPRESSRAGPAYGGKVGPGQEGHLGGDSGMSCEGGET